MVETKSKGHHHSHNKMSKRCYCGKLGKDVIDNKVLCRIHSPIRKGFETALKLKQKMESKK